ncbi:hypothetical protein VIN01S_31540 [Vibrio inusitatus NBRC 102082]|uniref:PglD N-terminal domain-containing protein n=1 Tax=Vibrio inusitatus NBRC 102082 TaxID=1219070 RepID=A0A4Y3I041_9VIBR|nr:acetyltransferase [Vibrio inusitatus]GEA52350.1 hypothetical protein VIN01S_31540 [Vibrio inusitatus NBRC 102082]
MNRCAIFGAGGHGKVVAEIAELNGYENIVLFDDAWPEIKHLENWSIAGDKKSLMASVAEYDLVVVAIGNNLQRMRIQMDLQRIGAKFQPLLHPSAIVSKYAKIGIGTVVIAGAVINPFTIVGDACIVNTGATIDHDCNVGHGVHISPGANIAGGVEIGNCSWVGVGSQIKQMITVGSQVVVGAGSTVINNVKNRCTVVGSPARILTKK